MPKRKLAPVPIFQSPTGRYYLWRDMAQYAQRFPNTWLFALSNVPAATVRAVKERRHPDLRDTPGGRLTAEGRNTYRDAEGRRMCDLFVRFTPEGDTP